jgi:hypothetical protein
MDNLQLQQYGMIERSAFASSPLEVSQSDSADIVISCFENDIPSFVEIELNFLYQNIFCSLAKFKIDGPVADVSTYVARKRGEPIAIFLFRHDGNSVSVLNEFMNADGEEINRFANHIFASFQSVVTISLKLVQTDVRKLALPYQRSNASEDIVVSLPGSMKEYLASLGKSTRQNINYYQNRLKRNFPSLSFNVYEKDRIDEQQFLDIMNLSRSRISGKGKAHGFGDQETKLLIKLAKISGLIGVLTIGGRVCAGTIYYRVGADYYLYVIAHDPAYNDYGLGTFCCYLTICECIQQGGKQFHFLWGREEYKYRLGGVQQDFDSLVIYRSRAHFLMHAHTMLKTAFRSGMRHAKLWLLAPARRKSFAVRLAITSVRAMRKLRHS